MTACCPRLGSRLGQLEAVASEMNPAGLGDRSWQHERTWILLSGAKTRARGEVSERRVVVDDARGGGSRGGVACAIGAQLGRVRGGVGRDWRAVLLAQDGVLPAARRLEEVVRLRDVRLRERRPALVRRPPRVAVVRVVVCHARRTSLGGGTRRRSRRLGAFE